MDETVKLLFSNDHKKPESSFLTPVAEDNLQTAIADQLQLLLNWANVPQDISQKATEVFHIFTDASLNRPVQFDYAGLSRINSNGLPFQWSFCFGTGDRSVRFLCESGIPGQSVQSRTDFTQTKLKEVINLLQIPFPYWLWDIVFEQLLPRNQEKFPSHWRSAIWTGVGVTAKGIMLKPYLNINCGTPKERWIKIGKLLKSLKKEKSLAQLCSISSRVSKNSFPIGIAFDVLPNGSLGRIKIYFESADVKSDWLEKWYSATSPSEINPSVRAFLDVFPLCDTNLYPAKSFIVSLEFHKEDGPISLKTDLAVNRWIESDGETVQGIRQYLNTLKIDESDFLHIQKLLRIDPPNTKKNSYFRFIGLGYEPDGEKHINIYVEPPIATPENKSKPYYSLSPDNINTAILKGVNSVIKLKSENNWIDYSLPVGQSDQWTTAFVLWQLSQIPSIFQTQIKNLKDVFDWLVDARNNATGWKYNSHTNPDVDSSSIVLLVINQFKFETPQTVVDFILSCQKQNGGFSTYINNSLPEGSWNESSVEITAIALQACQDFMPEIKRNAAIQYLFNKQLSDGTWPSFWWLSRLYPTLIALTSLKKSGDIPNIDALKSTLIQYKPIGAFDTSLLILCLDQLDINHQKDFWIKQLLNEQLLTGLWKPSAFLKLIDPQVTDPSGTINSGTTFIDQNALFTTVMCLSALSKYK